MGIVRANVVVGPARIVRGAGTLHVKDSFEVRLVQSTTPIRLDAYGEVDEHAEDASVVAQFVPEGRWDGPTRALLWPYLNPNIGSDVFGAADVPTLIHDSNSHLHTIVASAVTQMPNLRLAPDSTMVGSCTITGIRADNKGWADPDSLYIAAGAGGTLTDATFAVGLIKTQHYTGAWTGKTGFAIIKAQDGWDVEFETNITFLKADEIGTFKGILTGVSVMARCKPLVGPTNQQIIDELKLQTAGPPPGARGRSFNASAADLVITGADGATIITLKAAALRTAGFRFGANLIREGELAWVTTRSFAAGVPAALCTMA